MRQRAGGMAAWGDEVGTAALHPVTPCLAALALALAGLVVGDLAIGAPSVLVEMATDVLVLAVIGVPFAAVMLSRRSREARALRQAHGALHDLVERSSDLVFRLDTQGRFTYVNAAARRIYDFEPGVLLGRSYLELVADDNRPSDLKVFRRMLQGDEFLDHETVHRDATGRAVHLAIAARPVRNAAGAVIGVEGIAHDITQRAAAMEALIEAHDSAAAAVQAKATFLANMSHEIRTPMHGVLGTTRLLLQSGITGEPRRLAELVRESGESLLAVLDQVLDFSKLEAGRVDLENEVFDLRELAESIVRLQGAQAFERGIELAAEVGSGVPAMASGDPARLRQVLTNLVGNALKFTPRGGTVELQLADERNGDGLPRVRFSVRDTGIGISPAQIARVFEEFGQADTSTTRRFGGTGLGLTIARQLVQLMAGDIEVRSEPGRGSTFTFAVPLGRPAQDADAVPGRTTAAELLAKEPGAGAPRTSGAVTSRSCRILLAEDNGVNQLIAVAMLRRRGHLVEVAQNGRQAVEQALMRSFDVILMDVQMPELDGLGATLEIRRRGLTVPIVALTAHALPDEKARCLAAGMDDVLTKPFTAEALFQAVERWARQRVIAASAAVAPTDGPGDAEEGIALTALRQSLKAAGVESLLEELIAGFRRDAPGREEAIEQGLRAADVTAVARAAHAYKGSAGAVAARGLARALGELEAAGRGGDLTAARALATRVRTEHDRVLTQLAAAPDHRWGGAGPWNAPREVVCTG